MLAATNFMTIILLDNQALTAKAMMIRVKMKVNMMILTTMILKLKSKASSHRVHSSKSNFLVLGCQ